MPTNYLHRLWLFAPVALLALFALTTTAAAQGANNVGVVDLERVYAESALVKAGREELESYRLRIEDAIKQLQQQGAQKVAERDQLSPAAARHRELRQEIGLLSAQMQALKQMGDNEINIMIRRLELRFLRLARDATAKVAQERKLALVLRKSPPIPDNLDLSDENAVRNLEAKMAQQVIVYSAPDVDITSEVLLTMDEMFRAGNVGEAPPPAGGPATRPAAGSGAAPGGAPAGGNPRGQ